MDARGLSCASWGGEVVHPPWAKMHIAPKSRTLNFSLEFQNAELVSLTIQAFHFVLNWWRITASHIFQIRRQNSPATCSTPCCDHLDSLGGHFEDLSSSKVFRMWRGQSFFSSAAIEQVEKCSVSPKALVGSGPKHCCNGAVWSCNFEFWLKTQMILIRSYWTWSYKNHLWLHNRSQWANWKDVETSEWLSIQHWVNFWTARRRISSSTAEVINFSTDSGHLCGCSMELPYNSAQAPPKSTDIIRNILWYTIIMVEYKLNIYDTILPYPLRDQIAVQ